MKPEQVQLAYYSAIGIEFLIILLLFFSGRSNRSSLRISLKESQGEVKKLRDDLKDLRFETSKTRKDLESLKSQVVRVSSRMVLLQKLTDKIVSTFEKDQILESLLEALEQIFEVKSCYILLYDKEKNLLVAEVGFGIYEEDLKKISNRVDDGIIGESLKQRVPVSELDFSKDYKLKEIHDNGENQVVVAAPLMKGNEILGVIAIKELKLKKNLTFDDIRMLSILSNLSTLALKNANLFLTVKIQSITDGLTKLYNHRYFQQFLKKEMDRARRYGNSLSIILTDIDHFKKFNDVYGHQAGDFVLAETARIVKNTIRDVDLAARYGGEEFCVIFPEIDKQKAFIAAERVRKAIESATYQWNDQELRVTTSIGVSSFPDDADEPAQLIKKVDAALYVAKESGRNRTCLASEDYPDAP